MVYAGLRSPISRYARVAQRDINRPLSALDSLSAGGKCAAVVGDRASMAAAPLVGEAALAALAAGAPALGAGLGGTSPLVESEEEEAVEPTTPAQTTGVAGPQVTPATTAPTSKPPAPIPAAKPAYGVSAELAAIATEADPNLGLPIVQALAISRKQRSLARAYVKILEAPDVANGAWEAIGPALSNPDPTEFRRLAGLLFAELVVVNPTLDPASGHYDATSLAAALRELIWMCATPHRPAVLSPAVATAPPAAAPTAMVPHDPSATAAAIGAAMATALGAAFSGMPPPSKPAVEKMSVSRLLGFVEVFSQRPHAEVVVPMSDIANRTVFAHLYESAFVNGVWPQGEQTAPNAMAPFANSLGVFNTTDIPSLMLNPKSGHVEDASRDPTAAPAKSTEEYLAKVRILFVSLAVMLHGVKCDRPPHHIPGCEGEDFCSFLACNEWLGFLSNLGKASLKVVRSVVELTLRDVAAAVNTRSGARLSFTRALRANLGSLKTRSEIHLITLLEAGGAGGSSSAELSTPAAAKAAGAQSEDRIAEAITAGITTGLAGLVPKLGGGLSLSADDKKRAADEKSRKRREYEAEYEVDGAPVKRKAQRGGYDDAPKCTRKGCQKASWCVYSHAHMA